MWRAAAINNYDGEEFKIGHWLKPKGLRWEVSDILMDFEGVSDGDLKESDKNVFRN